MEKKIIYDKLNKILAMNNSSANFTDLELELNSINITLKSLNDSISILEETIRKNDYFDKERKVNDELISLPRLRDALSDDKAKLDTYKMELEELKKQENDVHQNEKAISDRLTNASTLYTKLKNLFPDGNQEFDDLKNNTNLLNNRQKEIIKAKTSLQNDIFIKTERISKIEAAITEEEKTIAKMNRKVVNDREYYNQDQKDKDVEFLDNLKDARNEKQKRKQEILTNPVYIAQKIRQELFNSESNEIDKKVLEPLVKIMEERNPYFKETSIPELQNKLASLNNELEMQKNTHQDKSNSQLIIEERLNYLNEEKAKINSEEQKDQQEITKLKTTITELLNIKNKVENDLNNLELQAENLSKVVYTNEYEKEQTAKDMNNIQEIIKIEKNILEKYNAELTATIDQFTILTTQNNNLANQKEQNQQEMATLKESLKNITKINFQLISENNDLNIKNIEKEINLLRNRLAYEQSPRQIMDDQPIFSSTITLNSVSTANREETPYTLDNVNIIPDELPDSEEIKKEEVTKVPEAKPIKVIAIEELESKVKEQPLEKGIKVINVAPYGPSIDELSPQIPTVMKEEPTSNQLPDKGVKVVATEPYLINQEIITPNTLPNQDNDGTERPMNAEDVVALVLSK